MDVALKVDVKAEDSYQFYHGAKRHARIDCRLVQAGFDNAAMPLGCFFETAARGQRGKLPLTVAVDDHIGFDVGP